MNLMKPAGHFPEVAPLHPVPNTPMPSHYRTQDGRVIRSNPHIHERAAELNLTPWPWGHSVPSQPAPRTIPHAYADDPFNRQQLSPEQLAQQLAAGSPELAAQLLALVRGEVVQGVVATAAAQKPAAPARGKPGPKPKGKTEAAAPAAPVVEAVKDANLDDNDDDDDNDD